MSNPVIVTSREELESTVADVVRREMLGSVPDVLREAQKPEWGGRGYVKERYGYTDRQLTYLRNQGRVRYSQHGRRIRYHIPSLERYIEEGTVQPRNGPLAEQD